MPSPEAPTKTIERTDEKTDQSTEEDQEPKEPRDWKVIMLNDEYTPMGFVVRLLKTVFRKGGGEATNLMLTVHNEGSAVVGVYPKEIAETKVEQARSKARKEGHPLDFRLEPEADEEE